MAAPNIKLISRCIADLTGKPIKHVSLYTEDDDITVLHVVLHYLRDDPFRGGPKLGLSVGDFTLYATLRFHKDFPMQPPKLTFESPWANHQHLHDIRICHSMLTDDFRGYFLGNGTHGTSMWNSACALADSEGVGGMRLYFQVLRDFLGSDLDYDEERHACYSQESLDKDAQRQREFKPSWLNTATRLVDSEAASRHEPLTGTVTGNDLSFEELTAAYVAAVHGDATTEACDELHRRVMAARPLIKAGSGLALLRTVSQQEWGTDFFLKSPTKPNDEELHPCFDITVKQVGRKQELSTTMTILCQQSFDLGAKRTDFGTEIEYLLPYPCSLAAWKSLGEKLTSETLLQLMPHVASFKLQTVSAMGGNSASRNAQEVASQMETILSVVGELWVNTTIGIVKDQGYESERAMMCFVTLHFLLLCLAEQHSNLRSHATNTVREFLKLIESEPERNLKKDVPNLGHFLVRFLLAEADVSLSSAAQMITRELFNRNVAWVDERFLSRPGGSRDERETQVKGTFESSQFGMKLTVFQSYYILRCQELGLDSIAALEACGGRPAGEALRAFQTDCRQIKEISSYQEFFRWMQLAELAERDPHDLLCAAVKESNARGYNAGKGQGGKGGGKRGGSKSKGRKGYW